MFDYQNGHIYTFARRFKPAINRSQMEKAMGKKNDNTQTNTDESFDAGSSADEGTPSNLNFLEEMWLLHMSTRQRGSGNYVPRGRAVTTFEEVRGRNSKKAKGSYKKN